MVRLTVRLIPFLTVAAVSLALSASAQDPTPPAGGSSESSSGPSGPDLSGATVVNGTLVDGDATRPNGALMDGVARVSVPAGGTLVAEMVSMTLDTYLLFEDAGGAEIAHNDDFDGSMRRSVVTYQNTSQSPEVVVIMASAYSSWDTGNYTVRYVGGAAAPTGPPSPRPISTEPPVAGLPSPSPSSGDPDLSGATVAQGELLDGDDARANGALRDGVATVSLSVGETLVADMTSDAFDTYLILETAGGQELAFNDDFGGAARHSRVTYANTSSSPVVVRIVASSYSAAGFGDYTVRYVGGAAAPTGSAPAPPRPPATGPSAGAPSSPPAVGAQPLDPGNLVIVGLLSSSDPQVELVNGEERHVQAYTIELDQGQTLWIQLTSEDFDTYLQLLRDGLVVAENDDFGSWFEADSDSELSYAAEQTGSYTVYVGSYEDDGFGAYEVQE